MTKTQAKLKAFMKKQKCGCPKIPGREQGHGTRCPDQAAIFMDGYCKTIRELTASRDKHMAAQARNLVYIGRLEAKLKAAEALAESMDKIARLDPAKDSPNGFNEWGESDCFRKAQKLARAALKAWRDAGRGE